jgi:hypothetical protein
MAVFPSEGLKITALLQIRWNKTDDMVLASDVKLAYTINWESDRKSQRTRDVKQI